MVTDNARIFISYSTRDGSEAAASLRRRLEAAGFTIWQDVVGLRAGHDWWSQIDETIRADSIEHLVLVVSDSALERPVIRQEIRLARQEGVQVTPVLATDKLNLASVPRWLGHVLNLEKSEHWQVLVNTLASPSKQARVPIMAPEPPTDYVARPAVFEPLKRRLINNRGDAVAITAALKGAGGYGKTTLAKALAHDADVQTAYFDGILWVEFGEKPASAQGTLADLIKTLTGERKVFETIAAASSAFAEALGARRILLVLDDVWREADLRPFLHGGSNTTRLVTTRLDGVVSDDVFRQTVDAMTASEAAKLIAWGLPEEDSCAQAERLKRLSARVGEWALLIKLVNGFLRQRVQRAREPLVQAIENVNKRLDTKGLIAFDSRNADDRSRAVTRTINASLDLLDASLCMRFGELGIFPEDIDVPIAIAGRLWNETGGLDSIQAEDFLVELSNLSLLLDLDLERRTFRLHDVMRQHLLEQLLTASEQDRLHSIVGAFGIEFLNKLSPEYEIRSYFANGGVWDNKLMLHLIGGSKWAQIHAAARRAEWPRLLSPYHSYGSGSWSSASDFQDDEVRRVASMLPEAERSEFFHSLCEGCAAAARTLLPEIKLLNDTRSKSGDWQPAWGDWQRTRDGAFEFVSLCMRMPDLAKLSGRYITRPLAEVYPEICSALLSIPGYHEHFTMRLSDVAGDVIDSW